MNQSELPKIIAVVGTNASGKSSVGIELAGRFGGEIISADSRQIYRGFDLCSGKVTAKERSIVPHHLLDIVSVGETYSAMDYQRDAYRAIGEILGRGKLPFLVGGTGLYLDAVIKGYSFDETPPDPALRKSLEVLPLDALRERVAEAGFDLAALGQSEGNNPRRLIRLLERAADGVSPKPENKPIFRALRLGVTWPREILHRRIDERLDSRVGEGMLEEVRAYLDGGGDPGALDDLGLEFRDIRRYLTGEYKSRSEFRSALSSNIKRFAKRQATWFRRDPEIIWLDMAGDFLTQTESEIHRFLQQD